MPDYLPRVVDAELDELLRALPALTLEGPKAVGKTETALRRARTINRLDQPGPRALAEADPAIVLTGEPPILIDEWQYVPAVYDAVRRAIDSDASPNRYLLAGSAVSSQAPTHSGAGRIVRVRMRPLGLSERGIATSSVSLAALLTGTRPPVDGQTTLTLADYAREIIGSGFPGLRSLHGRALRTQLDGYLARIVDRDFVDQGHTVRRPETLRRWMTAYAAATATTTTYDKIRDAATGGEGQTPARPTVLAYRDVLERLWILDPVPAWLPTRSHLARLTQAPKHHMADPALAARLLGVDESALLAGAPSAHATPRDGALMGQLFESLVTLSVRICAQASEATVRHLRTKEGRHEIDLIVERSDQRVLALEVKLSATVTDDDVRHLLWLREQREQLGHELLDAVVVTTGTHAYRRRDGVAVVAAALLAP